MRATAYRSLGGIILVAVALMLTAHQPHPTLIDRFLPVLVLILWALGWVSSGRLERDLIHLLIPLALAAELGISDEPLRMFLFGAILATGAVLNLGFLPARWHGSEVLTAIALVVSLRIVDPSIVPLVQQGLFVAGAVLLWRLMRRHISAPLVAAVVLLTSVAIPASPGGMAFVPWCLAALSWVIERESLVLRIVLVAASAIIAKWLAAAILIVLVVDYRPRGRGRAVGPEGAPLIVPGITGVAGNLPGVVLPLSFFPAAATGSRSFLPVLATTLLALVVRPSLSVAIIIVGLVVGCVRYRPAPKTVEEAQPLLVLPSLALVGLILAFFPWSGAIVARPPSLLAVLPVLAIAAIALLPTTLRGFTGAAAVLLFVTVFITRTELPEHVQKVGRSVAAGESVTLDLRGRSPDMVELLVSGANLADASNGRHVAVVEVLDAAGHGYRKRIEIGEIADWGAFRPELVLATWNPRPDQTAAIDGYGINAWVRGSGGIPLAGISDPRWVVVTGVSELDADESIIVEEVRYR